jgi:predicted permease
MRALRRFFSKLASLLFRGPAERELAREIQSHLAIAQDEFERRGMPADEARLAAKRAFGGIEQAKELHREARSFLWVEQTLQDVRHACRALARSPGFTFAAVLTLALGIGVNTTFFTLFDSVALKPLPVADAGRVVRFERWFESGSRGTVQYAFSYPEYTYARDNGTQFSGLVAASALFSARIEPPDSASFPTVAVQLVSSNYFRELGIDFVLGRGFLAEEDHTTGANPVAVLSHSFWRRRFQGDSGVLGRVVELRGTTFTIVGIAAEGFTGTALEPRVPDLWIPLSFQPQFVPGRDWANRPDVRALQILARLKPSVSLQTAQTEADLLVRRYATTYLETDRTKAVTLQHTAYFPNTDDIRFRALVAGLMLIVGLVLLVASANVGNMLLARGAARQREISTRLALGATRGRIARHLVCESILVSCMAGAAALALSVWTTRLLGAALQNNAMLLGGDFSAVDLTPDFRVLTYAMAVSLAVGIGLGISPAVTSALKNNGVGLGQFHGSRLRGFLVSIQVSVSVLLLATAGLLTRGLIRSQAADPGFDTRNIYAVSANFADFGADRAKGASRQRLALEKLRQRPEFAAVAFGDLPFSGTWTPPIAAGGLRGRTLASYASETYFSLFHIPFLRGRSFSRAEAESEARVAVISESTARRFWPNEDPLGKHLTLDLDFHGKFADFEVIGVAKDIRFANLTRNDPAHVYLPAGASGAARFSSILVRIHTDPQRALAALEDSVGAVDRSLLPDLEFLNLDSGVISIQRAMSRTFAILAATLAILALTLSGIGIYGLMAYLVSRRTREIGIRMALGAPSGAVLRNIVVSGLRPAVAGMVLGFTASVALSWVLHETLVFPGSMDFLYGVRFYDPVTFAGLIFFVTAVAAAASAFPAWRALNVDPMAALRYE